MLPDSRVILAVVISIFTDPFFVIGTAFDQDVMTMSEVFLHRVLRAAH